MFTFAASAFLVTALAYTLALKFFPRVGLLDFPERYRLKRRRLPYPGGLVASLVFLAFFASTQNIGLKESGVMIAVILLTIVSFVDDRTPLPSAARLLGHILVALILFKAGAQIYTITNPLGGIIKLDSIIVSLGPFGSHPIVSLMFTLAWLLLTINALNWFDGIPGQVNVISTIGFLMLGMLAYFRNDQPEIAAIAFILTGIAAAGIFFDFPPAKMILGDTGSMFFGLMLGLIGIYQGGKVATAFLALGIPLLDAAFVIIRRMMRGTSPFSGGRDHLHHLLLDRGMSERSVILLTAAIGSAFGAAALFMNTGEKVLAGLVLACVVLLLTIRSSARRSSVR